MKSKYSLTIAIIFVAVGAIVWQQTQTFLPLSTVVTIGHTNILVIVAQRQEALSRGLSGMSSLDAKSGMLFIMPQKDIYSFWMKDMLFPIDILWIANGKVLKIDHDVQPEPNNSSLKLYSTSEAVEYVLEVNAGFTLDHEIQVGDVVTIKN